MPGHVPVLRQEVVRLLVTDPDGIYLDATLGLGGHAGGIVAALGREGRVIAMDCDPAAVDRAKVDPPAPPPRFTALRGRFSEIEAVLEPLGISRLDGILADLGLSSEQLDDPARGLSFAVDGPLDLRLDPSRPLTGEGLLAALDDRSLERLLATYGELPRARSAVRAIRKAQARGGPIGTKGLRDALTPLYPGPIRPRRLAQVFQALRIAVNGEVEELTSLLASAKRLIRPGGTLCVLAYHSLEDRIVKQAFRPTPPVHPWETPPETPWEPLTRKPIRPSEEEIRVNPRARSARLRAARRKEAHA